MRFTFCFTFSSLVTTEVQSLLFLNWNSEMVTCECMQTIYVSVCVHMYICMHMYTYVHMFILCLYSRANTYMYSKWWVLFLWLFALFLSIQSFLKRVGIKCYGLSLYLFLVIHVFYFHSSIAFFVFALKFEQWYGKVDWSKHKTNKQKVVSSQDCWWAWSLSWNKAAVHHSSP